MAVARRGRCLSQPPQVVGDKPREADVPLMNIEAFHSSSEAIMRAVKELKDISVYCFPTGGTLIGALRWGHVCGFTGRRWNIADGDLDFICLVGSRLQQESRLIRIRPSFPDLQFEWRDDRKALMIRAQEAFVYVPDNHCHIWADKPCEKGKGRVDGFLEYAIGWGLTRGKMRLSRGLSFMS